MSGLAMPSCVVDIYPYEGGSFSLTAGMGLLACTTDKSIRDSGSGTFQLALAPGGPFGPEASPQWVDIIRPMSLVVIAMQRLGVAHIVMIGLVTNVGEAVEWQPNRGVRRSVTISGRDFSYIFSMSNFYGQMLFQFSQGAVGGTDAALGSALQLGVNNVSIDQAAQAWFSKIMAGQQGLLSKMNFAYQDSRVTFNDIMATQFGQYPDTPVKIPTSVNFAIMTGSWYDTFAGLYPFPWFELFVTTAEDGDYGQGAAASPIESSMVGTRPASPALIARFNPVPYLKGPQSPAAVTDLWDGLRLVELDTVQPIARSFTFSEGETKNLFAVNPTYLSSMFGASNSSTTFFLYEYGVWVDNASIARYGYRPFVSNPNWFADPTGDAAKSNSGAAPDYNTTVGDIALKAASYFEPLPLMAQGSVTTNLRPDIKPGTKLTFAQPKSLEPWDYYICGVSHGFSFGGMSTTTLTIDHGLPSDVYNDQGLLTAMMQGNAMRQDGAYVAGLPPGSPQTLSALNLQTGPALTSDLAKVYNAPGQK